MHYTYFDFVSPCIRSKENIFDSMNYYVSFRNSLYNLRQKIDFIIEKIKFDQKFSI